MSTVRYQMPVFTHTEEMVRLRLEDVRTSYQDANLTNATRMQHLAMLVGTTTTSFTTISVEEVEQEKRDVVGAVKSIFSVLDAGGVQPSQAALSAVVDTSNSATSAGNPYGESLIKSLSDKCKYHHKSFEVKILTIEYYVSLL